MTRPARIWKLLAISAALSWVALAAEPGLWRTAQPGYVWEFPRDLAAHPEYKTEWWYITGHLAAEDDPGAEPLGFQLTFFRVGLQKQAGEKETAWDATDLIMAHAAVTDPSTGEHVFSEALWRAAPFLGGFGAPGDSLLAWCRAPAGTDADWSITFTGGSFLLRAKDNARGLDFELRCTPTRPPVFHGQNGFSPKTTDGLSGSLYFSQTRMRVEGTVDRGGSSLAVKGTSWLDREIFTSTLAENQKGWDWLALGLVDGRDLMLYRLRDSADQESFALGTLVATDGAAVSLLGQDWDLEPLDYWVQWKLTIPGQSLTLLVKAVMPDQENVSSRTGIHYWEGAVTVHPWEDQEIILGRGFLELTGYGEGSRPPV